MAMSKSFAKKLRDKGWTIGNESRTWAHCVGGCYKAGGVTRLDRKTISAYRVGGRKGTRKWRWFTDSGKGEEGFETAEAAFVNAEISEWGADQ